MATKRVWDPNLKGPCYSCGVTGVTKGIDPITQKVINVTCMDCEGKREKVIGGYIYVTVKDEE